MWSLALFTVLAAAAAALPVENVPAVRPVYRCSLQPDLKVLVGNEPHHYYLCSADSGDHFVLADDSHTEEVFEVSLNSNARHAKQWGGYGGASANAGATAGGYGGGYGQPGFGGFGGPGAFGPAGGYGGSTSFASSSGFGGYGK